MRTWLTSILVVVFAIVAGGADAPLPEPESYNLEVSFMSPWNRDFTMLTTIRVGQPFEMVATNGRARNTVSGTLQPPKDGKYPIDLTVLEFLDDKSNLKSMVKPELELGKAYGLASSGGIIHSFTVILRRHESRISK